MRPFLRSSKNRRGTTSAKARGVLGLAFLLGVSGMLTLSPPSVGSTSVQEIPVSPGAGWTILETRDGIRESLPLPKVQGGVSEVLWRQGEDGLPRVSIAGFVHLRLEGTDFYYANILDERRKGAVKRGEFDTENWGDVDAFRTAATVLRTWRSEAPGRSRIGIEDISAEYGGFGDYDRDGIADHRTHQLGANLNFMLPLTPGPEVEVYFGVRNEGRFDREGARALTKTLFQLGGQSITTTSATLLLEPPEAFPMPFKEMEARDEGSRIFRVAERYSIILMKEPKNHGNHFNARITPVW